MTLRNCNFGQKKNKKIGKHSFQNDKAETDRYRSAFNSDKPLFFSQIENCFGKPENVKSNYNDIEKEQKQLMF